MEQKIVLEKARKEDMADFRDKIQKAFLIALEEHYGPQEEPIPTDEEIRKVFAASDRTVYHILWEGKPVGGAVIRTGKTKGHGELELFFISPACHSQGVGLAAWKAIENAYPEIVVWETITPYFEQRNIHFYINKCGFHAVEFFNKNHMDEELPKDASGKPIPGAEAFFRFEKVMK